MFIDSFKLNRNADRGKSKPLRIPGPFVVNVTTPSDGKTGRNT